MVPTKIYGRSLVTWLCYNTLPIYFGVKLYFIKLNVACVPYQLLSAHSAGGAHADL